jgi:hypothetical protein
MDGTLNRTKKYLAYFGRSFFRDKIALTFMCLICLTIVGIIVVATLPDKKPKKAFLSVGYME